MFLIFGPPGSGKGTQARLLEEAGLVKWFSTGQLLRDSTVDPIQQAKMFKGELVDDAYIDKILSSALTGQNYDEKPILLDGYPRSLAQVSWLFSEDNPGRVTGVIQLLAPQEELEKRLILRGNQEGRSDDNLETIKRRFLVYNQESLPAIQEIINRGVDLKQVNADQPIEAVHNDCKQALVELLQNANQG